MNLGKLFSDTFGFDPTPGWNLGWQQTDDGIKVVKTGTGDNPRSLPIEGELSFLNDYATPTGTDKYGQPTGYDLNSTTNGARAYNSSGSTTAVTGDPYAEYGGKEAYDARKNQFSGVQSGYKDAAETSLTDNKNTYDQKTRTFINSIGDEQGNINRDSASTQLNLRQSMANIIRGIQDGVRSGNVMLAGMNAADSGAADAIARAYAKVGNRQTGEARGQASDEFADIQRRQGTLDRNRDEGISDLDTWADTETNRVKADLNNKLTLLNQQAQSEGYNGVVDTGMVDRLINDSIGKLAAIDRSRNSQLSGVNSWTPDQIMQEAIRLEQQGVAGNPFSVTAPTISSSADMAGAPLGRLPIFVKGRDELSVLPSIVKDDNTRTA